MFTSVSTAASDDANDFNKKLSIIALSKLDQQEALRIIVTKVSASADSKTSTSSGGKIPLQSQRNNFQCLNRHLNNLENYYFTRKRTNFADKKADIL